jgi:hypothetical protein
VVKFLAATQLRRLFFACRWVPYGAAERPLRALLSVAATGFPAGHVFATRGVCSLRAPC